MTRAPRPLPRTPRFAGLALALAMASASHASTPTRPSTSPTQRTAARDTEASAPLAMQLSLPELMCSLALPAGWRRDAAAEGEPTQFRAPDGTTTYTVGVLRAPAPAKGAGRCEHARSMADIRRQNERRLMGDDVSISPIVTATTADTCTLRYEGYAPRYRHAYATFIVSTKGHVWTTFLESPTLSRAELTRLGDALFPAFRAQP